MLIKSHKSKIIVLSSLLLLSIALIATIQCSQKGPQPLTIFYVNDIHGHFLPEPASWLPDKPLVGGFAALDYYVKQAREGKTNTMLLHGGDLMTGNLICDMEYKGAQGGALVEMMNMIGFDCSVPGNHEFDKSISNLRNLAAIAKFPFVCANLVDSAGHNFNDTAYKIFNYNGLKVGVIGITYHQMVGMAKPANLEGFYSIDPAETVNKIVKEIDPQTDVLIVLSHLGLDADKELANSISNVDVIVGAHSHSLVKQPEKVNGILIVQAGSYLRALGELDLQIAGDTVYSYSGKIIDPIAKDIIADPKLQSLIDSFATVIDQQYGVVIGELKTDWRSDESESNVGDWFTDAIRGYAGSDVAFINSGGIRKNLVAGPITLRDIAEMLPFQNYIETFECTGGDLLKVLHKNDGQGSHGSLQLSGISYTWRKQGEDIAIENVMVGDKPLDPVKTYKIASIDYVNANWDKYYGFEPVNLNNTGVWIADVIIGAVKKAGVIDSQIEHRIKQAE